MTDAPKRIWEFDRYINGVLMAEGVTVEKQPDIASAMKAAAIIASRGPHGEVPVLIVREGASEHAALIREAEAERDEAQRLMQMRHREMLAADELMRKHQGRAVAAEADRDRLAAANAALEARLANGMKWCDLMDGPVSKSQFVNGQATAAQQIRAALAEVQADARREGGE